MPEKVKGRKQTLESGKIWHQSRILSVSASAKILCNPDVLIWEGDRNVVIIDQEMTEVTAGGHRLPDTFYVFGLTAALEDRMVAQCSLLPAWHLSTELFCFCLSSQPFPRALVWHWFINVCKGFLRAEWRCFRREACLPVGRQQQLQYLSAAVIFDGASGKLPNGILFLPQSSMQWKKKWISMGFLATKVPAGLYTDLPGWDQSLAQVKKHHWEWCLC